ncbi:MAG: hypothetical protein WAO35_16755 [Terriglobia bacterium]
MKLHKYQMTPNNQEIDWKFWEAVPVVFLVLWIGLRVFHGYFQLGKSLSVDGLGMVGTTLVAAALGFLAILLQVRSSSRQLRDQIKAQRDAERKEHERGNKAVAIAVLFEIDGFYRSRLRDLRQFLDRIDPLNDTLPGMMAVDQNPFPVYFGNASRIGDLEDHIVQAVVHFYGEAISYLSILRDYREALNFVDCRAKFSSLSPLRPQDLPSRAAEAQARTELKRLKQALPELERFAWLVCYYLCKFTGTEFKFPVIGAAAQNLSIKDFEEPADVGRLPGVQSTD